MKQYYPKTDADKEAMQMANDHGCFSMLPSEKQREVISSKSRVYAEMPLPKGAKITQKTTIR